MTIEYLSKKRKELRQQLIENRAMKGFKGLLTLLYSDKVHFIYELLQNAEDAKASEIKFFLNTDRLEFEHNGHELFTIEDVESITNIGSSTKADDVTSIGKFGIGFKAVFAYTATPKIESGPFHFRIHDMFVPETEDLTPGSLGERKTRFIFPFDNPEKSPEMASADIKAKLHQLDENTLMFLSNIRKIEYYLPDSTTGFLERIEDANDKNRIEISMMRPENPMSDSIHYLRFTKDVDVQDEDGLLMPCRIAIVFSIDNPEKEKWKIKSLNPGRVCIYFPATNATSNLRFHLHAPFASTVARDSIRECSANDELRDHLAELVAESMTTIREQGLLDVDFLATLPNDKEHIPSFYQPILKRLVEEFNTKKLVPMKQGDHATASESYRTARGERMLSDLINDQDLATLLEKDSSLPLWIANPPQINQPEDNFLSMLDISEWTIEDLIEVLETQSDTVMEWLTGKSDEWHQELYVFLEGFTDYYEAELSELPIVRCDDGIYRVGSECHFSEDDLQPDEDLFTPSAVVNEETHIELDEEENQEENFYYVSHAVYSSGSNKNQQQKARKFLETIGVTKVNDTERVKAILKQRYVHGTIELRRPYYKQDLEKFIDLVEKEPNIAVLFNKYHIFESEKWWSIPSRFFLDLPYCNTGLTVYHEGLDEESDNRKLALSSKYEKYGINLDRFSKFAEIVGVQTKLEDIKRPIPSNDPNLSYLREQAEGKWMSKTGNNEDYIIPELKILYVTPSIEKSKLIWRTMLSLHEKCLKAWYWNNNIDKQRVRPPGKSSLVHELKKAKWVPQKDDNSTSFVRPCDASVEILPKGFPYEPGQEWLKAIEFGKKTKEQKEVHAQRNQQAKDFGYDSSDEAEEVAAILKDWKAQGKSPEQLRKIITRQKRRKAMLIKELNDASVKEYEQRARNVRISRGKIDPVTPLRTMYTLENNMGCQVCKHEMPFKKRKKDEDYFEAVEALGKDYFPIEHEAQYLALCPVCSAKYKEYVKKDGLARQTLYNALKDSDVPEISFQVNGETIHIWFQEKHWHDLKTVIYYYENLYNSEDSTD